MNSNEMGTKNTCGPYGHCHLIIGPMFAGKTSKLIAIYREITKNNLKIKAFKHVFDMRYDDGTKLCSHDKDSVICVPISDTSDIFNDEDYNSLDVILIDEVHFFGVEIINNVHKMIKQGKNIILAGLSSDYKMEPIGFIPQLFSLSDCKTELHASCHYCTEDTPAHFTAKIVGSNNVIEVGSDNYKPVCRAHHYEHSMHILG